MTYGLNVGPLNISKFIARAQTSGNPNNNTEKKENNQLTCHPQAHLPLYLSPLIYKNRHAPIYITRIYVHSCI